jgi:twitching motility protein PilU
MTTDERAPDAQATLRSLLEHMVRIEASDLYAAPGAPPLFRVRDAVYPGRVALEPADIAAMADSIMSPAQQQEFRSALEMNLVIALREDARFCVNMYWQRSMPGMVVRALPARLRTLEELGHPPLLAQLALEQSGLVLVVGGRRSGKSTTVAALVNHRNENVCGHILTLEDPIELLHPGKQSVVTQREIGVDTRTYGDALRNAARQGPDMLMVDAVRNADVLESLLGFAAEGQFCVSTLHARSAAQAVERVLGIVPPARHGEILQRLSSSLRAVIAQRLVPTVDGGRIAALEIMPDTPVVKDLIKRGELAALERAITPGPEGGCTFEQSLAALVAAGQVGIDHALAATDHTRVLERLLGDAQIEAANKAAIFDPHQLRFAPEPAAPAEPARAAAKPATR